MNDSIRDRAVAAFAAAADALGPRDGLPPALRPFRAGLEGQADRLTAAMRVALVGRVSSGKSTLANALLGGDFAPVGVEELTYNVNWLTHGRQRTVTVHFRDGRPSEPRAVEDLAALTVRARDGDNELRALLGAIDYLLVTDPNPYLRAFDVIDTPGLDSVFQTDSQNTLRFLGRTGDDVRESSVEHAGKADALVAVFARGLTSSEAELLGDYGANRMSTGGPISTIGALTKVELAWPGHSDPMAEGARLAERVMTSPGASRVLYDLRPVASLVGAGAATLTDVEYGDLLVLAGVDSQVLSSRLRRGPYFGNREYEDLPVPARGRRALMSRLGQYGIWLAAGLMREGVAGVDELRAELTARSGMTEFKRLLVEHFGNRADLIKLRTLLDATYQLADALDLPGRDRLGLTDAIGVLRRLEQNEHAFSELGVLRQYYEGSLTFTRNEGADLLRVTGEYGTDVSARIGVAADAPREQQLAVAREHLTHWAARDLDPGYGGSSRRAVQVLRRTYERIVSGLVESERSVGRSGSGVGR